jgi:hypothetical protein
MQSVLEFPHTTACLAASDPSSTSRTRAQPLGSPVHHTWFSVFADAAAPMVPSAVHASLLQSTCSSLPATNPAAELATTRALSLNLLSCFQFCTSSASRC